MALFQPLSDHVRTDVATSKKKRRGEKRGGFFSFDSERIRICRVATTFPTPFAFSQRLTTLSWLCFSLREIGDAIAVRCHDFLYKESGETVFHERMKGSRSVLLLLVPTRFVPSINSHSSTVTVPTMLKRKSTRSKFHAFSNNWLSNSFFFSSDNLCAFVGWYSDILANFRKPCEKFCRQSYAAENFIRLYVASDRLSNTNVSGIPFLYLLLNYSIH